MQVRLENTESSVEKGQSEATENDKEREMDFEGRSVMEVMEGGMNDEGYMESTMIYVFPYLRGQRPTVLLQCRTYS